MSILIKKNPRSAYSLPQIECNNCGHLQTIFVSSNMTCAECFRYFHMNAFKIAKSVDARVDFHKGGSIYATGT